MAANAAQLYRRVRERGDRPVSLRGESRLGGSVALLLCGENDRMVSPLLPFWNLSGTLRDTVNLTLEPDRPHLILQAPTIQCREVTDWP